MNVQHNASSAQYDHEHTGEWQADQKQPIHPMTSPRSPKQQLNVTFSNKQIKLKTREISNYRIIRAKWRVSLAKFSSTGVGKPHIKPFICQKECQRTFWRKQKPCNRILLITNILKKQSIKSSFSHFASKFAGHKHKMKPKSPLPTIRSPCCSRTGGPLAGPVRPDGILCMLSINPSFVIT